MRSNSSLNIVIVFTLATRALGAVVEMLQVVFESFHRFKGLKPCSPLNPFSHVPVVEWVLLVKTWGYVCVRIEKVKNRGRLVDHRCSQVGLGKLTDRALIIHFEERRSVGSARCESERISAIERLFSSSVGRSSCFEI